MIEILSLGTLALCVVLAIAIAIAELRSAKRLREAEALPRPVNTRQAREDGRYEQSILDWKLGHIEDAGLLDPDQPTRLAHEAYTKAMRAPFTAIERQQIRYALSISIPEGPPDE